MSVFAYLPPQPPPAERRLELRSTGSGATTTASRSGAAVDLDAVFDELNKRHFSGHLGSYEIVWLDYVPDDRGTRSGAEGRFVAEDRRIEVKRGLSAETARATLLHEMVHAYDRHVIGSPPYRTAEAAHGSVFRLIATAIDPANAPRNAKEAEEWLPTNPTRGVKLPPEHQAQRRRPGGIERRSTNGTVTLR